MRERILIIDHQADWRERSAKILETQGFLVKTLDSYDPVLVGKVIAEHLPHLIILSCRQIEQKEFDLLGHILAQNLRVVVLSSTIPWPDMRRLFLAGAHDVTDKPDTQTHLLNIIQDALHSNDTLDSYQSVRQRGSV